ncbi:ROK family protein [Zhongshania guokunii]|uniref:ROK family protein n=1 Tax=Zhongshania guokunii TaxID=641783 RepID=A0ABV3U5K8_9GAMM
MRMGIDLGGTKIEGVVLSSKGIVLAKERVPTPQNYSAILDAIAELVARLETSAGGRASVGLGGPGAESAVNGRMKNSNTQCINGESLREDLSIRLRRIVRFSNDANCFALSEAVDGAGAAYSSVFGVILGTGTGGGLVFNKQVLSGANGIAGEWGHTPMPNYREGRPCYCGSVDCVETYLCGAGLARSYSNAGGEAMLVPEIVKRADAGEALANTVLDVYCRQLASALSVVINIVDPAAIVLGGGLSNIAKLYETVPLYWNDYVFSDRCVTKLLPAKYGDSSGVRGAAWLWGE